MDPLTTLYRVFAATSKIQEFTKDLDLKLDSRFVGSALLDHARIKQAVLPINQGTAIVIK